MNKILVTGGAGFIGSHLCDRLLNEGNQVICVDNFVTGRKENLINLIGNPSFKLIDHDIIQEISIEVDQIYNLACPASLKHINYDPIKTLKTNFIGSINLLELARQNNGKILQASTSEVYGDPIVHPQVEEYWGNVNPIGVRSSYDEGKRVAETLFMEHYKKYKTDIRIIRIFNTYGPKMSGEDGRVVSNFIIQALKGEDVTVYGDGTQTRSFCYVDDLVDGIIKMMNNNKGFIGPVNLGKPKEYTINELAKMIVELTGSSSKIIYKPLPPDDPKIRKPDISKAKKLLDWNPKIEIKDGLLRTVKYIETII